MEDLVSLNEMINEDGTYKFWDKDFSSHGVKQLGYIGGRLFLLDYDAVRPPHLVPKGTKGSSQSESEWTGARYLHGGAYFD
jgi:hypothetical protein